jgi:hypothetical protein
MTEEYKKSSLFSVQGLYKQMRSFVEIYLEPTSQNLNKKQKTKIKTKKDTKDKKICKKCGHHKCSHHEKHKKDLTEEMTTTTNKREEIQKRIMERRTPISKFDKNPYERNMIDEHEQTYIKKMDVEYRLSDDMMSLSPHYRKEEENEYKRNIEMKMEVQSLETETENISEWNHETEMKIDEYEENDIYKMDIIDETQSLENEDDVQSLEEDVNCDCAYHKSLRERKDMEILHEIDEAIH